MASLLGVEDGEVGATGETALAKSNSRVTLDEDKPLRPTTEMLAALTEQYSNIAIGKIVDVSEAGVRMMLKRARNGRENRGFSSLDDWQAVIIRAELKAELARKEHSNGTVSTG